MLQFPKNLFFKFYTWLQVRLGFSWFYLFYGFFCLHFSSLPDFLKQKTFFFKILFKIIVFSDFPIICTIHFPCSRKNQKYEIWIKIAKKCMAR